MPKTRKEHNFTRIAPWAAVGILLLAPAALLAQETPEPSGFLSDYSKLAEDPKEKGSRLVYRNPDSNMSDFDSLCLEEPILLLYPQDEAQAIDADEAAKMLRLVTRFDDVLREELEKQGANLVYEAGPGVLHCRWAITNLGKSKTVMRALPQARLIAGSMGKGRGGAAMEGECVDGGGSGEVVAQVVRADKGSKKSGVTTWAGADSAIRKWARELAERLSAKKAAA